MLALLDVSQLSCVPKELTAVTLRMETRGIAAVALLLYANIDLQNLTSESRSTPVWYMLSDARDGVRDCVTEVLARL